MSSSISISNGSNGSNGSSSDLKSFLVNNNILTTMAGVTIAFSTGTMIRSLVGDVILPMFYSFVRTLNSIPIVGFKYKAFAPFTAANFDSFIKELLTWIVVVVITYYFIDYLMKQYFLKGVISHRSHQPQPSSQLLSGSQGQSSQLQQSSVGGVTADDSMMQQQAWAAVIVDS